MNDIEVIEKIKTGEIELFRIIVTRYHQKVYNLCIGFTHQSEDAEDITQEILTKVYIALPTFEGKSQFSTWLYRIALNTIYSTLRQKKKKDQITYSDLLSNTIFEILQVFPKSDSPDYILNEKQINQQVYQAIDTLPEKQRTAFLLSKYEDLSQREIAETMNISEEAVESLLQRGRRNLQSKLKKFYYFEYKPTEIILAND